MLEGDRLLIPLAVQTDVEGIVFRRREGVVQDRSWLGKRTRLPTVMGRMRGTNCLRWVLIA